MRDKEGESAGGRERYKERRREGRREKERDRRGDMGHPYEMIRTSLLSMKIRQKYFQQRLIKYPSVQQAFDS